MNLPSQIKQLIETPIHGERFLADIRSWWRWRNSLPIPSIPIAFNLIYKKHMVFRSITDYRLRSAGVPHWSGIGPRVAHLHITYPDIGGG